MELKKENFAEYYPDFKGVFIPQEILEDKSLTASEKLYLSLLKVYNIRDADKIICLDISQKTLENIKTKLEKHGYLNFIKQHEKDVYKAKEMTIKFSHNGYKCEWCGQKCYVLHKHHFPVSAKDGGTETVDICPNCHYTFHNIIGR